MTAILDINLEKAQAVAEEILSQEGKKSIAVRMDITDSQEVKRAVREVEETFGRVDVLINNVGLEAQFYFVILFFDFLIFLYFRMEVVT